MHSDLPFLFGKMFPDFCLADLERTSEPFSLSWTASGIVEHGQLLTLDSLVSHSADDAYSECSLSQILEPDAAPKYCLSPVAAAGILRRAAKRGRTLPAQLEAALAGLASTHQDEGERTTVA